MLKHHKIAAAIFVTLSSVPLAQADSTLVYELTGKDGSKVEHTISITGRWLRLESKPKAKSDYTIMDLGRLMKFEVDEKEKTFQVTRLGRLYWPETALNSPEFKPIKKKNAVAGVRCQPVHEMGSDNKPVAEHCMTIGGPLGMDAREMITLSRLFMSNRRIGQSWLGLATPDERQVSILSQNPAGEKLQLKSVSHKPIDKTLLRIPVDFERLQPDLPVLQNKKSSNKPAEEKVPESKTSNADTTKGSGHSQ
jgi:hypothetical protein